MNATSYEVNPIRLDMICQDHLAGFIMEAANLADHAEKTGGRFDIADIFIEKTSIGVGVKIIQETDKAWKVNALFMPSFFIKRGMGRITSIQTTQWIPKSKCSIVSDNFDTVVFIPNWLMRKIIDSNS